MNVTCITKWETRGQKWRRIEQRLDLVFFLSSCGGMCHPFCTRCSCCQCLMWSLSSFTLFQIYDYFYFSWKWCAQALSLPIKLARHDSEWKIHLSSSVIQPELKWNVTALLCWQHWIGFIKLIFYHHYLLPHHSCMSWTTCQVWMLQEMRFESYSRSFFFCVQNY